MMDMMIRAAHDVQRQQVATEWQNNKEYRREAVNDLVKNGSIRFTSKKEIEALIA